MCKAVEHANSLKLTDHIKPGLPSDRRCETTRPFAQCSRDLITDLPPVKEHDLILVMVDQGLLKGEFLCPCIKMLTWEGATVLLHNNLFKRFGLSNKMISDREPQFTTHVFQELLKLLKIYSNFMTAYHPQSDKATEQVNQEIKAYLAIYCMSHPENWLYSLGTLEFMHNNWQHAERVYTPFKVIQGDSPISIPITFSHTKFPSKLCFPMMVTCFKHTKININFKMDLFLLDNINYTQSKLKTLYI